MQFLALRVRNALLMHGYDEQQCEITEAIEGEHFVEKLIAVARIQSVSEQYILVSSSHGRMLYWEYEGGFSALRTRLAAAGLLID
ncbi:hypothetical protein HZU75_09205 [Chitinibacter fontanus]|uniref:Uncharacterized protein n=1 Tax=Chitinibacter fontanus TaxID=1737446 RepID=A0A7D5VAD0_9NEIS|nr:hypothetical protein [Chitinibacter fontanus]QLI81692.1 hypothetical protein HZU75_09205 [Chitinibacter fontanus]